MSKSCAGLAVIVLSLAAFGIGHAQIALQGVLDPNTHDVVIDSAIVWSPTPHTFRTAGWQGSGSGYDTFEIAPNIPQWPDSIELIGTVDLLPNISMFPAPIQNTFYRFLFGGIVAPRALFYQTGVNVEEPKTAVEPQQRLNVNPSVVNDVMTVRLTPVGTGTPVVQIHDAVGNVVRSLECTVGANGSAMAAWNREDGLGRIVPEGIYFCRYASSGVVAVRKVLVTH